MSFLVMLVSAFGIGALHSLEPGHGKSIMGAYLVLSYCSAFESFMNLGIISYLNDPVIMHTA